MYLAPGAQTCPNCHLDLRQMHHQQNPYHVSPLSVEVETGKEKLYRKLLVALVIIQMGEFAIFRLLEKLNWWAGINTYWITRPLGWLSTIGWTALPLVVALIVPKSMNGRVVLIVFAVIYALWKLSSFIYEQFYYDYDSLPYYNF